MIESWLAWPDFAWPTIAMAIVVCVAFVAAALRRPGASVPVDKSAGAVAKSTPDESLREQRNQALFEQKQADWEAQYQRGELPHDTYTVLLAESRQQLLAETKTNLNKTTGAQSNPGTGAHAPWLQRSIVILSGLLIPVIASLLYFPAGFSLGASDQYAVVGQLERLQQATGPASRQAVLQTLLEELERQTHSAYPDPQLLQLHGDVLLGAGRFQPAEQALRRLLEQRPDDAGVIALLAEAHYLQANSAQESSNVPVAFPAAASQMVDRALQLQPDQPRALGLAGIRAFGQGQWQQAIKWWQRALAVYPSGSREHAMVSNGIKAAQARLDGGAGDAGMVEVDLPGAFVKLLVSVDQQQLRASDTPDTPVFVFARPADGTRMPLAARRLRLGDLPATIILSERDQMAARSLADTERVIVAARLARSGQPIAASGDLEAKPVTVDVLRPAGDLAVLEQAPVHALPIAHLQQ